MRALVLVLVLACGSSDPRSTTDSGSSPSADGSAPSQLGVSEQGVATYYDATGAGNCSFDPSPNDLDVAAMDDPEWQGSAVCGACAQVAGPKGSVTVRIVDRCPECEKGHLDLSKQAFAKIADVAAGKVPITWSFVPCNVSGPVQYQFKQGSSQWWTAIQVRNHRAPIRSLAWNKAGTWIDVKRESYNYFVEGSGVGTGAVRVRITSWDGQTLEDTLPGVMESQVFSGAAQFK